MIATSLEDDLLGIPGVEGADVEGSAASPQGLRIRIAEGADQEAVGGAIRRVLSSHGLGTDTQLPGENTLSEMSGEQTVRTDSAGTGSGRTIIDITDDGSVPDEITKSDSAPASESTESAPELEDESEAAEYPSFVIPRESREPEVAVEPDVTVAESSVWSIARIENVAVEEGRGGVLVTVVASDGTEATKSATPTEGGVELAVVRATAELVNAESPDPIVVDIEDRRIEGIDMVIVVLNVNGKLVTGSSVVAAGRPFALGRATWAALAL